MERGAKLARLAEPFILPRLHLRRRWQGARNHPRVRIPSSVAASLTPHMVGRERPAGGIHQEIVNIASLLGGAAVIAH